MVLRFLGESVTDSNGLAVLPDGYTGTGAGLVDIVAKTTIDESTVVSQPYEVLDCIYYDDMSSDRNTNYYFNGTDGTSITYDSTNQALKITCGTNNARNYVDLRTSNSALNLNDVKGKTVRFKVTITGLNGKRIKLSLNGGTIPSPNGFFATDGEHYEDCVIDSDATIVVFAISPLSSDWSQGDTYSFKDFEIYPI